MRPRLSARRYWTPRCGWTQSSSRTYRPKVPRQRTAPYGLWCLAGSSSASLANCQLALSGAQMRPPVRSRRSRKWSRRYPSRSSCRNRSVRCSAAGTDAGYSERADLHASGRCNCPDAAGSSGCRHGIRSTAGLSRSCPPTWPAGPSPSPGQRIGERHSCRCHGRAEQWILPALTRLHCGPWSNGASCRQHAVGLRCPRLRKYRCASD
jgi:hypothetical protein